MDRTRLSLGGPSAGASQACSQQHQNITITPTTFPPKPHLHDGRSNPMAIGQYQPVSQVTSLPNIPRVNNDHSNSACMPTADGRCGRPTLCD
ncbi:hypothetical protein PAXRUDRAFT_830028 [Paxillus rubicundulus Ve08.2h10]|uniref:Uncharacterized protein n=1 Tax=Paxillus rubicundulus Ve08.2h10 TaxID=930991 RepID=A0A0D0DU34_9AGAM|nr:hypothetical protein PAXRUDRAFT_830028 [Paxillus rubicundulus Ve08.2h10]